ncbi:MAG: hypothetical protein R3B48_21165 [Kofleriaceae bacterium]
MIARSEKRADARDLRGDAEEPPDAPDARNTELAPRERPRSDDEADDTRGLRGDAEAPPDAADTPPARPTPRERPRSDDEAANARGLKVHLRVTSVGGVTYHIVSLRPSTVVRFSTNFFHQTWHVLTGRPGAAALARLLWGLSFQRTPNTLVMLDHPHVVPTPFEGDRGDPIALIPASLTRFDAAHLPALRRRLAAPPTKTIRWHTFGLPAAIDAPRPLWSWRPRPEHSLERMSRAGGVVCYTAPPTLLRETALHVHAVREFGPMSYVPVANRDRSTWRPDGEFQIFSNFEEQVAAAIVARREVVDVPPAALLSMEARQAVWKQQERVLARRRAARQRSARAS